MIQLSPHFSEAEFCRSQAAARRGIKIEIPSDLRPNLIYLCTEVLEPLREHFGVPVTILSGYRPPVVNVLVGGARSSQHLTGKAVDLLVAGVSPCEVCQWIASSRCRFDQVILEFGQWTHVSAVRPPAAARRSVLTAIRVNGRTQYQPGLIT